MRDIAAKSQNVQDSHTYQDSHSLADYHSPAEHHSLTASKCAQYVLGNCSESSSRSESVCGSDRNNAVLVIAPPRSGKTEFAIETAKAATDYIAEHAQNGSAQSAQDILTSSARADALAKTILIQHSRQAADRINPELIRHAKAANTARPATTLSAFAFRIISEYRAKTGQTAVKLINGSEQEVLLRRIMRRHVNHAVKGESGDCGLCELLARFCSSRRWASVLSSAENENYSGGNYSGENSGSSKTSYSNRTQFESYSTAELFECQIDSSFIKNLRDMFARINELGAAGENRNKIPSAVDSSDIEPSARSEVKQTWQLVFALQREYEQEVRKTWPGQFRLDSSQLLVEGAKVVRAAAKEPENSIRRKNGFQLPKIVIVDDVQDVTLAGAEFLRAIRESGASVVLIGNSDESVQTFRGSYPEFIISRAQCPAEKQQGELARGKFEREESEQEGSNRDFAHSLIGRDAGCFNAKLAKIAKTEKNQSEQDIYEQDITKKSGVFGEKYLDVLSSRVSLSIPSSISTDIPLPARPEKLPNLNAYPINKLPFGDKRPQDGSANVKLYRSAGEEIESVVSSILDKHISDDISWNDMAVIAHDNSTVRAYGDSLRRRGVPVRYSSVSKPLAEEMIAKGLMAFAEFAQLGSVQLKARFSSAQSDSGQFDSGQFSSSQSESQQSFSEQLAAVQVRAAFIQLGSIENLKHYVESRIDDIILSPLVGVEEALGAKHGISQLIPLNLKSVKKNLRNMCSLISMANNLEKSDSKTAESAESAGSEGKSGNAGNIDAILRISRAWFDFCDKFYQNRSVQNVEIIDDFAADLMLDPAALLICMILNFENIREDIAQIMRGSMRSLAAKTESGKSSGKTSNADKTVEAFLQIFEIIDRTARDYATASPEEYVRISSENPAETDLPNGQNAARRASVEYLEAGQSAVGQSAVNSEMIAKYALSYVWRECAIGGVSICERLRFAALYAGAKGNTANDMLDVVIRFFSVASRNETISASDFFSQIRDSEIAADSLAATGPKPDAVTLTTPAGAAGQSWDYVWIPALQEGVWPNLASRNTVFYADELTDIMLNGHIAESRNMHSMAVLHMEKRIFLVAVTRADKAVYLSACDGDDNMPSAFLSVYLPEIVKTDDEGRFAVVNTSEPAQTAEPVKKTVAEKNANRESASSAVSLKIDVRELTETRKIIAAARAVLACEAAFCESPDKLSDCAKDAVETLKYLESQGYSQANIENWNFVSRQSFEEQIFGEQSAEERGFGEHGFEERHFEKQNNAKAAENPAINSAINSVEESETVLREKTRKTAVLSPSAVESICQCAVCWKLDRVYGGPRDGNVNMSFGTLIHAVAQQASEENLDMPSVFSKDRTSSAAERFIAQRMREIYEEKKGAFLEENKSEFFGALKKDKTVSAIIDNIAHYFVNSCEDGYGFGKKEQDRTSVAGIPREVKIKTKESDGQIAEKSAVAECEKPILAQFCIDDIAMAVNACPDVLSNRAEPVSREELFAVLDYLAGGFPDGADIDMIVQISGKIDRLEYRTFEMPGTGQLVDGIRILDYKTSQNVPTAKDCFSNMQLICYQLSQIFKGRIPADKSVEEIAQFTRKRLENMPYIAQCSLFYPAAESAPSSSRMIPEVKSQMPLMIDGHLNSNAWHPRPYMSKFEGLWKGETSIKKAAESISEEAFALISGLSESCGLWALTMIAKVFYAAAATLSEELTGKPDAKHKAHCAYKNVCPVCADRPVSVIENAGKASE